MSLSSSCTQSTGFTHGMACRRGRKVAHGMGEASSTGLQHSRLAASPPLSGAAHPERPSNVDGTADRQHYVKEGASAKRKAAEVQCQCKLSPACSPWSSRTAQSATTWRRGWHTGCAGGHLPADMSSRIKKVSAQSQLMMLCIAPDGAHKDRQCTSSDHCSRPDPPLGMGVLQDTTGMPENPQACPVAPLVCHSGCVGPGGRPQVPGQMLISWPACGKRCSGIL